MSAIPVMTTTGIEDMYTTTGIVNGDKFVEFFFVSMYSQLSYLLMVKIHVLLLLWTMPVCTI